MIARVVAEASERAIDVAAALAAVALMIGGLVEAAPAERFGPVRLALAALNGTAAVLFFRRSPSRRDASTAAIVASTPGVLIGATAFLVAPPLGSWPLASIALVMAGGAIAIASLATLGKSFAVLPAARAIVTRGPYRWIRHPAYFGELVIVAGAMLARRDAIGAAMLALAIVLIAVRILTEEKLLSSDESYTTYAQRVRYRLLYGVW